MEYEEFLAAEHKLHVASDKKYQAHLKEMQALTQRQVEAQEAIVAQLAAVNGLVRSDSKASKGSSKKPSGLEKQREADNG
jgi:hypothetical protein